MNASNLQKTIDEPVQKESMGRANFLRGILQEQTGISGKSAGSSVAATPVIETSRSLMGLTIESDVLGQLLGTMLHKKKLWVA